MSKMIFGLEQVLSYRKEVEKVCKMEFTAAQQEFDGACERLNREEGRVSRLNTEVQERQREGITAMELQIYANFFRRKIVDIDLHRKETATLNDRMAQKRDILVEAAKEKKALETLKEKKLRIHNQDVLNKERIFLEEIALRNKGNGN
ncbi:MAG: flagellar export protein FliJ [Desulfobacteraceae bacterium]|nr:flagellar export protein FliJ [Desulfobacteraceae bacterium]